MKRQYWAQHDTRIVGPCDSREEALEKFRAKYPFKGEPYEGAAKHNQIITGYGSAGAWFDLRWDPAIELCFDCGS